MKIAKLFAGIFGSLGALLMAGSIGLCLISLDAPVRMNKIPAGAVECAEKLEDAITQKDFDVLEACIYGQPELGMSGAPEDELTKMVWDLVQQNLEFSWQSECYLKEGMLRRDAVVSYMDAASITDNLPVRAYELLTQKVEAATEMEQLYADGGQFREDLLDEVMKAALTQACMEDAKTQQVAVCVEFVSRDGQWWAVPDTALLTALSGGLM